MKFILWENKFIIVLISLFLLFTNVDKIAYADDTFPADCTLDVTGFCGALLSINDEASDSPYGEVKFVVQKDPPVPTSMTNGIQINILEDVRTPGASFPQWVVKLSCNTTFDITDPNSYTTAQAATCNIPLDTWDNGTYHLELVRVDSSNTKVQLDLEDFQYNSGVAPGITTSANLVRTIPWVAGTIRFHVITYETFFWSGTLWDIHATGSPPDSISRPDLDNWPTDATGGWYYECYTSAGVPFLRIDLPQDYTDDIECNISNIPRRLNGDSYKRTLSIYTSRDINSPLDSIVFDIPPANLVSATRVGATGDTFTILFSKNFKGTFTDAGNPVMPNEFFLRLKNGSGAFFGPEIPGNIAGVGTLTIHHTFRGLVAGQQYPLVLYSNINGNIKEWGSLVIEAKGDPLGGTCTCAASPFTVSSCADPSLTLIPTRDSCFVGQTAAFQCLLNVTVMPPRAYCQCSCTGTPELGMLPAVPGLPAITFSTDDIYEWLKSIRNLLIAVAVISSVVLLPLGIVFMASGEEQSIKKGKDIIVSLLKGLAVVFLAAALIRILGAQVFKIG